MVGYKCLSLLAMCHQVNVGVLSALRLRYYLSIEKLHRLENNKLHL